MNEKQKHKAIGFLISALATMCAADEDVIIEKLTGYLWDEEEAGDIKRALNSELTTGE